MSQTHETVEQLPTPKLIAGFGNSKMWLYISIAVAVHVAIIGATSVDYLQRVFDPAGYEAKKHAEEDAKTAKAGTTPPATQPGQAVPPTAAPAVAKTPANTDPEKTALEAKKDTSVVKKLNDTAKPGELPKKPDELGIGLDETNPR